MPADRTDEQILDEWLEQNQRKWENEALASRKRREDELSNLQRRLAEAEAQLAAVDNMVGGLLRERELTFEGERAVSILALVNWLEGQTEHKVSIVEELLAEEREKRQRAVEALALVVVSYGRSMSGIDYSIAKKALSEATQEGKKPQSNGCQDCQAKGYKCAKCYSESCLCGGVGCNSCEPRGPY